MIVMMTMTMVGNWITYLKKETNVYQLHPNICASSPLLSRLLSSLFSVIIPLHNFLPLYKMSRALKRNKELNYVYIFGLSHVFFCILCLKKCSMNIISICYLKKNYILAPLLYEHFHRFWKSELLNIRVSFLQDIQYLIIWKCFVNFRIKKLLLYISKFW